VDDVRKICPSKGKEYENGINRIKGLIRGWELKGNDSVLKQRIQKVLSSSKAKLPL